MKPEDSTAAPQDPEAPSTDIPHTPTEKPKKGKGVLIAAIAAATLGIGIAAFFIIKKRKK